MNLLPMHCIATRRPVNATASFSHPPARTPKAPLAIRLSHFGKLLRNQHETDAIAPRREKLLEVLPRHDHARRVDVGMKD